MVKVIHQTSLIRPNQPHDVDQVLPTHHDLTTTSPDGNRGKWLIKSTTSSSFPSIDTIKRYDFVVLEHILENQSKKTLISSITYTSQLIAINEQIHQDTPVTVIRSNLIQSIWTLIIQAVPVLLWITQRTIPSLRW